MEVLLISVCYLYKRHLSKEAINQSDSKLSTMAKDQRAVQGCQGQDCRPTQGWNGLQDHRQAAWWEGDNSWCDYSQMEETQNNCQSPSVWGSMQELTSWSFYYQTVRNPPRTTREDLVNDLKAAGTIVTKKTIGNTLCSEGLKSCSARKVPCSRKHMYSTGPSEVCQWFRGELGESVVVRWGQNRALWHQLNSPCLEEEECCLWPQEHHPHRQTWRWKHYALGVFFC